MSNEHMLIGNLTEAYEKSPRDTMVALWVEFRGKNQRGNIVEFATYITTNYPEIAEKISATAEKEFVRGWKNVGEARKLHSEVSRIRENGLDRREFIGRSVAASISSCLNFPLFTGPSLAERLLAQHIVRFATAEKVILSQFEDPSMLIWRTSIMKKWTRHIAEGFEYLFLDKVNEKEHGIFLGEKPGYETEADIIAWHQYERARRHLNDQACISKNPAVLRLHAYFDTYSEVHAEIMRKLPVDIIHEIGDVWYTAASNHSKYPDGAEIIQKSAKNALRYKKDKEQKHTEEQLRSIDEMEGHYHGRAILEEWKKKANTETTSDYKKHVEKERKKALQTLKKEWGMAVGSVIGDFVKLEEKYFPKKGKIIIP